MATKTPRMTRANAGRVAQHEGTQFEKYIENLPCPPGVWLHRTPGRTKAVRGAGGRWVLVPDSEGKGLPDFHGGAFGRAVVFDAKRCETGRWGLSGLTVEQRQHLQRVYEAGGIAGVWLRFCEGSEVLCDVWLAYLEIAMAERDGVKALTVADAKRLGAVVDSGCWWEAAGVCSWVDGNDE